MSEPMYTVLIVEDSATMRFAYSQALSETYALLFADNPLNALAEVAKHRPDVILLDVNLRQGARTYDSPEANKVVKQMDGLDVCAAIKRSPFRDIPIIMLTGRDGFIDKMRGKLARADCYLIKPVTSEVLKERIREALSPKIVSSRLQRNGLFSPNPHARGKR